MKNKFLAILLTALAPTLAMAEGPIVTCKATGQTGSEYTVTSELAESNKDLGNGITLYYAGGISVGSSASESNKVSGHVFTDGTLKFYREDWTLKGSLKARGYDNFTRITVLFGSSIVENGVVHFKANINHQRLEFGKFETIIDGNKIAHCTLTNVLTK